MVLQLFWGILFIGALFLGVSRKRRRIWSLLMLGLFGVLAVLFWAQIPLPVDFPQSYRWLSYKGFSASFVIGSSPILLNNLNFLLPVWLASLYLNLVYSKEEHPLTAGNISMLMLAAFIFMASSQDFMQLMAGSCCFSILGFYLINDNEARNKFIFYNFTAEMAVFTALAVVYAKTGIISLDSVGKYASSGWHRDLVAVLLWVGIFIKCGMFLFQNQFSDLQNLDFNRLFAASLLGAPMSGLLLYLKVAPLTAVSGCSEPLLYTILALSVLYSLGGMLWQDNLKSKILYFNMLFFAFSLFLLHHDTSALNTVIVPLLPWVLLADWCLMLASISASDEIYVSQMGGFAWPAKYNLLLSLGAAAGFSVAVLSLGRSWPFLSYLGISLAGLAANLHCIYLGKCHADEKVCALLRSAGWRFCLPILLALGWMIWLHPSCSWPDLSVFLSAFALLLVVWPQKLGNLFADSEFIQDKDWLTELYRLIIVAPLHLLGRVLWLAVDFVVIERRVIGTVSNLMEKTTTVLEKMQSDKLASFVLWLLFGLFLLAVNIGVYIYE